MRTIADGVKPSEYGRREAFRVHQGAEEAGPRARCRASSCSWTAPRSGSAACSCTSTPRLNFYRLFNEAIEKFSLAEVGKRQAAALAKVGLVDRAA